MSTITFAHRPTALSTRAGSILIVFQPDHLHDDSLLDLLKVSAKVNESLASAI